MSTFARYGFAALAVLTETLGLQLFGRVFDVERAPFFLFTPSVFVAAVVGGLGPGVFATLLGSLAVEMVIITSQGGQGPPELARLALFVAIGTGISVLAGSLRDARALAEERERIASARADELAVAREASHQHAREAERRAAEFDALFEVAPIGIARADDPTCRNIRVNRSLAHRLGVAVDAGASAGAPAPHLPPLDAAATDGTPMKDDDLPLHTAARTRRPVVDAEFSVVRGDGATLTFQAHALPLLDERGEVRGAFGVFSDVTEDRRAAFEQRFLAEASRLLGGSLDYEETLRQVVSLAVPAMADWVVLDVVDERGHVSRLASIHRDSDAQAWLEANAPLRRAENQPPPFSLSTLATQPLLLPHVTDDHIRALGATEAEIEHARPLGVASALVVPLTSHATKIGAVAWMRGRGRAAFDARDLALAEEVSRRAAVAVEHARLYREAQSANRLKDEFVATLSHELRTPLNALLGWIDLLRSGRLSPDRAREAIEAIHRTAAAQAQLTNDLVDVSRAVSGKFRLSPRDVEIGTVVRAAVETFRLAAESKGLWLRCHVDPDLPRTMVDPDRLQQIAYNLVGNAVKFTASGGVDVTARRTGEHVEISVRDTGIGIDPAFLPHVFDRFRQADGTVRRSFGGLGLGLSIARTLVELHGGTVTAESAGDGQGATFTVRLPLAPSPRRAAAVGASESA